jgi:hypothetical protein
MTAEATFAGRPDALTETVTIESLKAVRRAQPALSRVPTPSTVVPMRAFIGVLIVVPRIAIAGWALVVPAENSVPTWVWLAGLTIAPFTALVLLIAGTAGLDPLDWVVLGLAVLSDVLVWVVVRFERRYGPSARADRVDAHQGHGSGNLPDRPRSPFQQWLDVVAMGMPWPGVRLQAALRGWPAPRHLSKQRMPLMPCNDFRSISTRRIRSSSGTQQRRRRQ